MKFNSELRLISFLLFLLATISACEPDQRLTQESLRNQFSKNEYLELSGVGFLNMEFIHLKMLNLFVQELNVNLIKFNTNALYI
jgi:hypothetical protein